MAPPAAAIPVNVITGFLGSGKTSLLQRLLVAPEFADTAVLINEFGEIGLDHYLLEAIDEDIVLLQSGCVCCTIRGELSEAIRDLYARREQGAIPAFRRLVIETTGLADPAPILSTLMSDPVLRHHFRLGNVIATVDAVNGATHLDRQPESVKQAAIADRLILTKTDLASPAQATALRERLARLNPTALLIESANRPIDPGLLLAQDLFDATGKSREVRRWLDAEAGGMAATHSHRHGPVDRCRHDTHIRAFTIVLDAPLDWTAFGAWLTMLLQARGADVLRVKGLLRIVGTARPVVIHGVQHLVHPPVHLSRWPDADRRSRLVFIVRDIEPAAVDRSLRSFLRLGERLRDAA